MKHNLYGKKMFIIDLFITTFWALFSLRYAFWSTWPILLYILMRLVLCFEMQRRSPWVLISAIAFTLCYCGLFSFDVAVYPIKRLAYYFGAWAGYGNQVAAALRSDICPNLNLWLQILTAAELLWLIGVPFAAGVAQRNIREIDWKKKWVIIYVIVVLIVGLINYLEPRRKIFVTGFLLTLLPLAYWCVYKRNKRSIAELMIRDKSITTYLQLLLLFLLCIFIGASENYTAISLSLLLLPPLFYFLICRAISAKPLTRHVVALSVSGILYCFTWAIPLSFKIVTLSISIMLVLYVSVDIALKYHSMLAAICTFILETLIVCPTILGMNPYAALDTDWVEKHIFSYEAPEGIYILYTDEGRGLRDRYGVILEPKYRQFESLDKDGQYISVSKGENDYPENQRYGIYDIQTREFLLDPDSIEVTKIQRIDQYSYSLHDRDDIHFATLILRGYHPEKDKFVPITHIEPCYPPAELTLEENPEYSRLQEELGDCQQSDNAAAEQLRDKARVAVNREYKKIIDQDSTYRNVYDRWSDLMAAMSNYLIKETYGAPWYSMQPIQYNADIRGWYETLLPEIAIDRDILFAGRAYKTTESAPTQKEIDAFFDNHKPSSLRGYNRMWSEIRPAFEAWWEARTEYAETLSAKPSPAPNQDSSATRRTTAEDAMSIDPRTSYDAHTAHLVTYLFAELRSLPRTRNANLLALPRQQP